MESIVRSRVTILWDRNRWNDHTLCFLLCENTLKEYGVVKLENVMENVKQMDSSYVNTIENGVEWIHNTHILRTHSIVCSICAIPNRSSKFTIMSVVHTVHTTI